MEDHPTLGVVLFVIGAILVGWVYLSSHVPPYQLLGSLDGVENREAILYLLVGHIVFFNGVLLFVLGRRKLWIARLGASGRDPTRTRAGFEPVDRNSGRLSITVRMI